MGPPSHTSSHADSEAMSEKSRAPDPESAGDGKSAPAPAAVDNTNDFPDGGFDAWFTVAGGFCTVFASFGWINCKSDCASILAKALCVNPGL